jgi:hypothetical protein
VRAPGIEHIDDHVEVDGISRADGLAQPGQGLADGRKPGGTQGPVDQIRHLIDDRVWVTDAASDCMISRTMRRWAS